ncbi:MAG: 2-hydroxyacyl-CoA dehydratase, partial [Candidatus Binatia bacterium]
LARKIIAHPFNASLEHRIRAVQRQVEDYHVDGVIFYAHVSCRNFCGGVKAIQDALLQNLGVHSLLIKGDMVDGTGYDAGVARQKIREFLVDIL